MAIFKPQSPFSGPPPVLYGCNFLDINGDNTNFTFTPLLQFNDPITLPNIKTTIWRDVENTAWLELLSFDNEQTMSVQWSIRQLIPNSSPNQYTTLYASNFIIEYVPDFNISYESLFPPGFTGDYDTLLGQWYWYSDASALPGYVQDGPVSGRIRLLPSCSNEPDPLDQWELSSTEYPPTNIYYCNNNRIYYDRNDIDKNVLNQLDQQDKYLSNFTYPDELAFGVNYSRANNRALGVDNFDVGIAYKLYLNTFIKE
jgi:hypothetical protein